MKDILWYITSFDAHNSMPFEDFEEGVRPLLSMARAKDRIKHLIHLIDIGIIDINNLAAFLDELRAEMGIDLKAEKWTFKSLVALFRRHEKYVPIMFEYLPYDMANEQLSVYLFHHAVIYVYGRFDLDNETFDRARSLLTKLKTVLCKDGQLLIVNEDELNVARGLQFDFYRPDSTHWITNFLHGMQIPRKEQIMTHLTRCENVPNDRLNLYNALIAYCRDEPINDLLADTILNNGHIVHMYLRGHNEFYEYLVAASSDPNNWPYYINHELMKRAFIDPQQLIADAITIVSNNLTRIKRDGFEASVWLSFLISIGAEDISKFEIEINSNAFYAFIFGQQSIINYKKAFGLSTEEFISAASIYGCYSIETFNSRLANREDILIHDAAHQAIRDLYQIVGNTREDYYSFEHLCDHYEKNKNNKNIYEDIIMRNSYKPFIGDFILKYSNI